MGAPVLDTLSRPLRDLRISVTDRCNFRCTYCMPQAVFHEGYSFLDRHELLSFEEIARLARIFVSLGVSKLRITGGEPLLRRELPLLTTMLSEISGVDDIALTTNGVLLPALAEQLREAGLHRVTVSLDTLDDAVFARMNGRGVSTRDVIAGIDAARVAGFSPIKVNAVVQRGVNDDGLLDLVAFCRERACTVRFIEYMDVGTMNQWRRDEVVPSAEIRARIHARWPLIAVDANYRGETAVRYAFADGHGEVGFISSVTQPFCGDCSRARLSADGTLYTCLFATAGTDLRGPLRAGATDEELARIIMGIWQARGDRYSELRAAQREQTSTEPKVEMYHIGG